MSSLSSESNSTPPRWADRPLVLALLLIVALTLFPYHFVDPEAAGNNRSFFSLRWGSALGMSVDLIGNALLFAPLGFRLA